MAGRCEIGKFETLPAAFKVGGHLYCCVAFAANVNEWCAHRLGGSKSEDAQMETSLFQEHRYIQVFSRVYRTSYKVVELGRKRFEDGPHPSELLHIFM